MMSTKHGYFKPFAPSHSLQTQVCLSLVPNKLYYMDNKSFRNEGEEVLFSLSFNSVFLELQSVNLLVSLW